MRKLILAAALAAAAIASFGAVPASSDAVTNAKHFFWAQGEFPPSSDQLTSNIIWHAGNAGPGALGVLTKPSIYLVYWGTEWAQGFKIPDTNGAQYGSKALQNYLNTFAGALGGSRWMGVATQYCRGITPGSTTCKGDPAAEYVTNPTGQLKGVWTDASPVPDAIIASGLAQNLVDDPLAAEAVRAANHFGKWDPQAVYFIITPPRPVGAGQPAYCGYHTQTTSVDGLGNPTRIQYSFIPWQNTDWPGLGQGCGLHVVNKKSNSFGNGIFDSWSVVVGHEYSEAVTDPDNFAAVQDGWNDDQTSENADKCAWTEMANVTLGSHYYAMQPTWSNEAFDAGHDPCAMRR